MIGLQVGCVIGVMTATAFWLLIISKVGLAECIAYQHLPEEVHDIILKREGN